MSEQERQSGEGRKRWRGMPTARYIVIEFLIVFLGVYLAYVFNDLQEGQRERRTQIKFCETLIHEFQLLDSLLEQQQAQIEGIYQPTLDALAAGRQPALPNAPLYFDFEPLTAEAGFDNDRNFEALPQFLLANLVNGNYAIRGIRSRIEEFRARSRALDANPGALYTASGDLRADLHWYPALLTEISALLVQLRAALEIAIPHLTELRDELEDHWW